MTLDDLHPRTRSYIETAEENEQYARELLRPTDASRPAVRWASVVVFYAAVHYVGAYLWERARLEPIHHQDRESIIENWPDLTRLRIPYTMLKDLSVQARYTLRARVRRGDVQYLLVTDLGTIKDSIRASLDL